MIVSCPYGNSDKGFAFANPFCIPARQPVSHRIHEATSRYFTRFLYARFFGFLNLLSEVSAMPGYVAIALIGTC